eukprot:979604-Prorocentrum_minimum.AAC.1
MTSGTPTTPPLACLVCVAGICPLPLTDWSALEVYVGRTRRARPPPLPCTRPPGPPPPRPASSQPATPRIASPTAPTAPAAAAAMLHPRCRSRLLRRRRRLGGHPCCCGIPVPRESEGGSGGGRLRAPGLAGIGARGEGRARWGGGAGSGCGGCARWRRPPE